MPLSRWAETHARFRPSHRALRARGEDPRVNALVTHGSLHSHGGWGSDAPGKPAANDLTGQQGTGSTACLCDTDPRSSPPRRPSSRETSDRRSPSRPAPSASPLRGRPEPLQCQGRIAPRRDRRRSRSDRSPPQQARAPARLEGSGRHPARATGPRAGHFGSGTPAPNPQRPGARPPAAPIPGAARDTDAAPAMAMGMLCAVNTTRAADRNRVGSVSMAARTCRALASMKRMWLCQSPT